MGVITEELSAFLIVTTSGGANRTVTEDIVRNISNDNQYDSDERDLSDLTPVINSF